MFRIIKYLEPEILRTMAFLEPGAYSEHCQTSTMEHFAFCKCPGALSYILGNEAFLAKISLIFRKVTFPSLKKSLLE